MKRQPPISAMRRETSFSKTEGRPVSGFGPKRGQAALGTDGVMRHFSRRCSEKVLNFNKL